VPPALIVNGRLDERGERQTNSSKTDGLSLSLDSSWERRSRPSQICEPAPLGFNGHHAMTEWPGPHHPPSEVNRSLPHRPTNRPKGSPPRSSDSPPRAVDPGSSTDSPLPAKSNPPLPGPSVLPQKARGRKSPPGPVAPPPAEGRPDVDEDHLTAVYLRLLDLRNDLQRSLADSG
jgi:hypothetical protein